MQITQFVIDLVVVYFGSTYIGLRVYEPSLMRPSTAYEHYASTYYHGTLPHIGNCAGTETAALFGCGLITIYLCLFINFYLQTYKTPAKRCTPAINGNGIANGNGFVSCPLLEPFLRFLLLGASTIESS